MFGLKTRNIFANTNLFAILVSTVTQKQFFGSASIIMQIRIRIRIPVPTVLHLDPDPGACDPTKTNKKKLKNHKNLIKTILCNFTFKN